MPHWNFEKSYTVFKTRQFCVECIYSNGDLLVEVMKEQSKSEVLGKCQYEKPLEFVLWHLMAASVYHHSDTRIKTRHLFIEPISSNENSTFDFLRGKINLEGFGEMWVWSSRIVITNCLFQQIKIPMKHTKLFSVVKSRPKSGKLSIEALLSEIQSLVGRIISFLKKLSPFYSLGQNVSKSNFSSLFFSDKNIQSKNSFFSLLFLD